MRVKYISEMLLVVIVLILSMTLVHANTMPSGGSVTPTRNETAPADPPGKLSAFAGNVTAVNIYGFSTTRAWQGYYGNVSGVIELTDNLNNTMYNWSQVNPRGEVYAVNMSSVLWTHIQCFNLTANGSGCNEDDWLNNGSTETCGMNNSQLEVMYGINVTNDVDGVNATFNRLDHRTFYTNNLQFTAECPTTRIYNQTGPGNFEEVLLWSPENQAVVFTSLLEQDAPGFDGSTYDFEMMVLDNGHGTDLAITDYYFWLELE